MYKAFFGLKEAPFALTPNTSYYYGLPPHQEALQVLQTALESGEGFIKVTGEVGTGKTLVLRKLMNADWSWQFEIAYLPNPYLTASEMRVALAKELGLDDFSANDELSVTDAINRRLIELNGEGRHVVMLVDEAQDLPDETLEAIRLFGNLETESAKLIQIVLFGQPELDYRLSLDHFRQLRQRISFSYSLRALNFDETSAYISYRLKVAGYNGYPLFTKSALKKLWKASRGIPRLINILAHKGLMLAYGKGISKIKASMIKEAIADTPDAQLNKGVGKTLVLMFLLLIVVAIVIYLSVSGWFNV